MTRKQKSVVLSVISFVMIGISAYGYNDDEVIDIRAFNYGRLQIALTSEKTPGTRQGELNKAVELLKRNLMWSGLFDIKNLYDTVDLTLKLRFIPDREIRIWIATPDNTTLFDHSRSLAGENDLESQVIRMVEEIIFQLTGERTVLRSAIAYVEKNAANAYRIMLSDAFGEKRIELLNDGKFNILPRWKPDASALIFTSLGQEGSHLRMLTFKTGEIVTLFKNLGKTSGGSWARSGSEIVVTRSSQGSSNLFKIDLKGNILEQMTFRSSTDANPRLSPDGKRLLFVSNRSGTVQIYQRIMETGETFRMTFEGNLNVEPNWSNDGAYIVFSGLKDRVFQIFLMDKDGDFMQQITHESASAEQPVWSPNGRQVLFVSKANFEQKLFIIRADGTFRRRLTESGPGISEFNPTWTSNFKWDSPNVSPN